LVTSAGGRTISHVNVAFDTTVAAIAFFAVATIVSKGVDANGIFDAFGNAKSALVNINALFAGPIVIVSSGTLVRRDVTQTAGQAAAAKYFIVYAGGWLDLTQSFREDRRTDVGRGKIHAFF